MPLRDASSALYNGMIAPLIPFAFKAVIWYQGENTPAGCNLYNHAGLPTAPFRTDDRQ
jgi:sialate O-acetylesterase